MKTWTTAMDAAELLKSDELPEEIVNLCFSYLAALSLNKALSEENDQLRSAIASFAVIKSNQGVDNA
jgi:hypothetical protein